MGSSRAPSKSLTRGTGGLPDAVREIVDVDVRLAVTERVAVDEEVPEAVDDALRVLPEETLHMRRAEKSARKASKDCASREQ
jgi:hypothetical protein